MKKTLLLLVTALCALVVCAEENRPSLFVKAVQMEKLQRGGRLLEAMDTATVILGYDRDNRAAVDFIHRNWDRTMRRTQERLDRLSDPESLEQARERCEVYRLLDEIYANLRVVRMPLYGPRQSWVWQPETGYYSGHYDDERQRAFNLCIAKADAAMRSLDADEAGIWYNTALNEFLLTDGERKSNKALLAARCEDRLQQVEQSDLLYEALFAYDLAGLLESMQPDATDWPQRKQRIQQHVASLYLQAAQQAYAEGDSLRAEDFKLSYEDWKPSNDETDNSTDGASDARAVP